ADALLALRIADIAAGPGIFLVAAAEYLAARLVEVGLDPASALREVVRRCLFGVDLDPTAVELSRLTLWLLAADADLSLDDLSGAIRCGDALLDETWVGIEPFDAVLGNPPFLGVKSIRGAIGQVLRDRYAATLLGGESGRSDLVVFFLARAARQSRSVVALVLPDAVAEGDSARFGFGALLADGARIYRAETSRPWPGDAGVRIALVWLQVGRGDDGEVRGGVTGGVLDGVPVPRIGPSLGRAASTRAVASREPPAWMPHGYQATIVLGKSLLLTVAEADAMVAEDPRAARWIRPYLSGVDVVATVGPTATRRVLDLGSTDLEELLAVPPVARRLDAVRAERTAQLARYPQLETRWWGFLSPVDRLYADLVGRTEVIALAKHAKYVWPVLVPTGPVFSNGAVVYPTDDRAVYGLLASEPHRLWAVQEGGSRLNQSHRYNPSRLLRTYPFPDSVEPLREPGEALATAVRAATTGLVIGVTELLNLVHSEHDGAEVDAVRSALAEVDRAALVAHGIDDLRLVHALRTEGARTWFGLDPATSAAIKEQLVGQAL
ncbi:MAG: type IIL restriction-modification enzyme MmeI, partial [Marmoricola sp.]